MNKDSPPPATAAPGAVVPVSISLQELDEAWLNLVFERIRMPSSAAEVEKARRGEATNFFGHTFLGSAGEQIAHYVDFFWATTLMLSSQGPEAGAPSGWRSPEIIHKHQQEAQVSCCYVMSELTGAPPISPIFWATIGYSQAIRPTARLVKRFFKQPHVPGYDYDELEGRYSRSVMRLAHVRTFLAKSEPWYVQTHKAKTLAEDATAFYRAQAVLGPQGIDLIEQRMSVYNEETANGLETIRQGFNRSNFATTIDLENAVLKHEGCAVRIFANGEFVKNPNDPWEAAELDDQRLLSVCIDRVRSLKEELGQLSELTKLVGYLRRENLIRGRTTDPRVLVASARPMLDRQVRDDKHSLMAVRNQKYRSVEKMMERSPQRVAQAVLTSLGRFAVATNANPELLRGLTIDARLVTTPKAESANATMSVRVGIEPSLPFGMTSEAIMSILNGWGASCREISQTVCGQPVTIQRRSLEDASLDTRRLVEIQGSCQQLMKIFGTKHTVVQPTTTQKIFGVVKKFVSREPLPNLAILPEAPQVSCYDNGAVLTHDPTILHLRIA